MSTNGDNNVEDTDMADCEGEKVVTMMDVLQEQQDFEDDANAVLGASDEKNCTYSKGYIKRQAIYACMTCCSEAKEDPSKRAGVCLACSLNCHENHELIELYTKRNFRCDCGNPKFNHPCQYTPNKNDLNVDNKYNQNFAGVYCNCHRPYPDPEATEEDEMIQCIICEDWLHSSHLDAIVPGNEQYSEMVCKTCMDANEFLNDYTDLAVNVETEVDVTTVNGDKVENDDFGSEKLENGITETASEKPPNMDVDEVQAEKAESFTAESTSDNPTNDALTINDAASVITEADKTETSQPNLNSEITNIAVENGTKEQEESPIDGPEENKENPPENNDSKAESLEDFKDNFIEPDQRPKESQIEDKEVTKDNVEGTENVNETADDSSKDIIEPQTGENKSEEINATETTSEVESDDQTSVKNDAANVNDSAVPSEAINETATSEAINETATESMSEDTATAEKENEATVHNDIENKGSINDNSEEQSDTKIEESTEIDDSKPESSNDITDQEINGDSEKSDEIPKDSPVEEKNEVPNVTENKRKLSTDEESDNLVKKAKLEVCSRPKGIKRLHKGAVFWPANFRQKLCTCSECLAMYKDLSVLYLIDPEDTVSAYETLGKEREDHTTQYEKGLEALSSLGRIQQINALTEYNKMRDKLLDFLKSFKDRKEIVKEEDIKAFFAGMKPKREPDGVYFCR